MAKARNYKAEYKRYHGKPEQIKRRAERGKSRSLMIKKHGKAALKGKDVDHKDRNTANMSSRNLRIQSRKVNRGRNK